MNRFILGVLMTLLIIIIILFTCWMLNSLNIIDIKSLVLGGAGRLCNLSDLAESYELGKKRSPILKEREKDLAVREKSLENSLAKFEEERSNFENDKLQWQKTHLPDGQIKMPGSSPQPGLNSSSDSKVQQFLAQVGGMKPSKAAEVLQSLPDETVFQILDLLRSSQVTKIMENMPSDYLARLTKKRALKKS